MKHFWSDFIDALRMILRKPGRSALSSLGVLIGVASLVAMLSIGEGAEQSALEKIETLGADTVRVEAVIDPLLLKELSSTGLTMDDFTTLKSRLGGFSDMYAFSKQEKVAVESRLGKMTTDIYSVTDNWFEIEKLSLSSGRFLNTSDYSRRASSCVIGSKVAQLLRIEPGLSFVVDHNFVCQVVGILRPKGALLTEGTGLSAIHFDTAVFLPSTFSYLQNYKVNRRLVDGVVIRSSSSNESAVWSLYQRVVTILSEEHFQNVFKVVLPLSLLEKARETQFLFSFVMGSIAALSLIVAGIGIMNVMLANIAEQTREIALRVAVGATRFRIQLLYLLYSAVLSLIGAILGLLVGLIIALVIQSIANWEVAFSLESILFAPAFAVCVGVLFGLYPAYRASRLNVATALREN